MQANQYQYLTSLSLFSSFSPGELLRLFTKGAYRVASYTEDQIISLAGEQCSSLDVILTGSVSLQSLDEQGRLFKAQVLGAGDVYGATLVFGSSTKFPMSVVSEGVSEVLHLSKAFVLTLCKENTLFTEALLQIVSDRAHSLSTTLTNLTSKPLRENLLSFLREEAEKQKSTTIKLQMSKKELAHRLGVERTSLSRALALLREEGILRFTRDTITLLDIERAQN